MLRRDEVLCGAGVEAKASLRVALNVTQGAIRAVYLKSQTCPVFPDDIEGEQCRGLCHMTWYTEYDKYSGELIFKTSDVTTVPIGDGEYPDKRASGEWFIGIHASDLRTTEFELEIAEVAADTSGDTKLCDRFGRYDCDNSMWKVPPDLPTATLEEGAESAAARGAHAAPSVAAFACGGGGVWAEETTPLGLHVLGQRPTGSEWGRMWGRMWAWSRWGEERRLARPVGAQAAFQSLVRRRLHCHGAVSDLRPLLPVSTPRTACRRRRRNFAVGSAAVAAPAAPPKTKLRIGT